MGRALKMRWSSLVWLLPGIVVFSILVSVWLLVARGIVTPNPSSPTLVLLGLLAVAASWSGVRYCRALMAWLRCMFSRKRVCLSEDRGEIWYLDPLVMRFHVRDVAHVEVGPKSGFNQAVRVFLYGRDKPLSINGAHFEGGAKTVASFIEDTRTSHPTSPWN